MARAVLDKLPSETGYQALTVISFDAVETMTWNREALSCALDRDLLRLIRED